ncbi:MAG: nucleoside hydrolase [Halobacteriales archaeon]
MIDTDTAGDDTQALLLALASERVSVEGVTICAGNVPFEYQVENAKFTLQVADAADDVPVYEGAREPMLVESDHAAYVHGEGGLGGERFPDTGIPSADRHAATELVDAARSNPGELTLVCLAPLTNVALALQLEPDLGELYDEVWVMGGNVNCLGNVTPAAEFNFWYDPHAARMVLDELNVVLFDWGVTVRDSKFDGDTIDAWLDELDSPRARLFADIATSVRAFTREQLGGDYTTQPDAACMASLIEPALIEESGRYKVDVDDRDGLTRGYSAAEPVDDPGAGNAHVIQSFDGKRFEGMFRAMLAGDAPESAL